MARRRKWLEDLFAQEGKTRAALGRHLAIDPSRVSEIISGKRRMTAAEIAATAGFFGLPAERVFALETATPRGSIDRNVSAQMPRIDAKPGAASIMAPPFTTLPKDVPVYGTVVGGTGGGFHMNGEVVDRVRRPPGLADVRGAYGLYISGDSMEPRYFSGELIYINPGKPAAVGDFVVVEMHAVDGEAGQAFVKRLVRRTATTITAHQYNPAGDVVYEAALVKRIWRIVPLGELMGV